MYFSIDPGKYKFGWAFTGSGGKLLCSGISASAGAEFLLSSVARSLYNSLDDSVIEGKLEDVLQGIIDRVFLGDGTGSDGFFTLASGLFPLVILADERGSTLEARHIFWKLHPPRGWRRFLPLSLQMPPRPVDDLAAYCIALRALKGEKRGIK